MKNTATAIWKGKGASGEGQISTKSKVLNGASYSYRTRTQWDNATNPEELVAAAHAGCFAMKLAFVFESAGYAAEEINATCEVTFEAGEVKSSHIELKVRMTGIGKMEFDQLVEDSGKNCPVSKLLNAPQTVHAELLLI
jgi:osmotically inducible protein OsmC